MVTLKRGLPQPISERDLHSSERYDIPFVVRPDTARQSEEPKRQFYSHPSLPPCEPQWWRDKASARDEDDVKP